MQVVYAREPFPDRVVRSMFLAGPTPRQAGGPSWRPEALQILSKLGYEDTVFVPEPRTGSFSEEDSYLEQVEWELAGLARADAIVFWVPRDLDTLPGFTTNVELGYWVASGRVIFGAPERASKVRYLEVLCERNGVPRHLTLAGTLDAAIASMQLGAPRLEGECSVPAMVFHWEPFQAWYGALRRAGNVLLRGNVEWVRRAGPSKSLFMVALHAVVRVTAEDRVKKNELVLMRPDIAATVLFSRGPSLEATEVVLVREFRTAGTSADGYVREPPGGSSFEASTMRRTATQELEEEAGIRIEPREADAKAASGPGPALSLHPDRVHELGHRSIAATLLSHHGALFSVELTTEEMSVVRKSAGKRFGADDGERTTVEIFEVGELLRNPLTDWSSLGMIFAALCRKG
ncbi:MAG: nucleoside 2-deoxyribosyltransferase domain-containing protein [Deltaproteobacteria bacterium]|nr:nucleoside 2-deoxyribosyltransferase domain-containing protein [Deltaproteobacteria bacterium]